MIGQNLTSETQILQKDETRIPLVKCQNVFKIYKQGKSEIFALNGLNLTLYPGEIVLVMGPSGAGKTTLLNVIAGLEQPTGGKVSVKNLDITRLKEEQINYLLQNEIGIVFQFFNLLPQLTVYGNIELPMIISGKKRGDQKERIKKLIVDLELSNRVFARPFALSGGERQRLALAMALVNNPSLILADEPTGNLDSITSKKIVKIFRDLKEKNPELGILIVSHNPIFREIADKTLVIRDGKIIKEITDEEFRKEKIRYRNLLAQSGVDDLYLTSMDPLNDL